jgi:hypothetical protein
MTRFNKIYFIVIPLLLNPIFPQDAQVRNVSFDVIKNDVYIYYDLTGEADTEYEVTVVLRRETISGYIFPLRTISGDVGKGKFAGEKRTIIWDVSKDFHIDEEVTDYYFEVTAEKVGGIPWYYYVGGGLVAGAAAALIIGSGGEEQTETKTAIQPPPVRP